MKILDKGEVSLINFMGGDLAVVAAARVSNGVDYSEASKGEEADQKLINFLLAHRHGTPFEHSTFQFYVKTPLFVRSEWHRHRIASYNEISGRYVKYEPEFYIPDKFRAQSPTNKQGSFFPTSLNDVPYIKQWDAIGKHMTGYTEALTVKWWDDLMRSIIQTASEAAFTTYQNLLDANVAKEMARMILPTNLYTQFYFTVNARSLMNFLSLRCAEDAQWEIRQYALAIRDMFKDKMPMTYLAWEQNSYVAP